MLKAERKSTEENVCWCWCSGMGSNTLGDDFGMRIADEVICCSHIQQFEHIHMCVTVGAMVSLCCVARL